MSTNSVSAISIMCFALNICFIVLTCVFGHSIIWLSIRQYLNVQSHRTVKYTLKEHMSIFLFFFMGWKFLLGALILPLSTIFLLYFGISPTVWHTFVFSVYSMLWVQLSLVTCGDNCTQCFSIIPGTIHRRNSFYLSYYHFYGSQAWFLLLLFLS